MSEDAEGDTFYVGYDRIRKHDGYVYWWGLLDYLKPDKWGDLSSKTYHQGDCKLFRIKYLSFSYHKEPMGRGIGEISSPKNQEWQYPPPHSVIETILKSICSR